MKNPIQPVLKFLSNPWVPGVLIVVVFGTIVLSQAGYITLPHFGSGVYEIPDGAKVGTYFSYDVSDSLIAPQGQQPHTYYLGSGTGFPPMGLTLDINGMVKGTPTTAGTSKFQVCVKNAGGQSACRTYSLTVKPKTTTTPTVKPNTTPTPSTTLTPTPATIDLNGLWNTSADAGIKKITQTGTSVVITYHQIDPSSRYQQKNGDVAVQATLSGNKLTGQVKIYTEKGYCDGTTWWHPYSATVSEDGTTIQETFQSIIYYHETCQETGGSYPQKTNTLTKIQ